MRDLVPSACSRRCARKSGVGRQSRRISRTGSGIGTSGASETSWRMSSIGKSGARSSGPTGWPVPGCRTGCGRFGMSAATLYQRSGSADSGRSTFVSVIAREDSRLEAARKARPLLRRQKPARPHVHGVLRILRSASLLLVLIAAAAVAACNAGGSLDDAPARVSTGAFGKPIDVGPGLVDASVRQVVRTPGQRVWIFAADDTAFAHGGASVIRAWRATTTGIPFDFK